MNNICLSSEPGRRNLMDVCGAPDAAAKLGDWPGSLREPVDSQAARSGLNVQQTSLWFNYRAGIVIAAILGVVKPV